MMTLEMQRLAVDIASRIPEMAKDGAVNNAVVISHMIEEACEKAAGPIARPPTESGWPDCGEVQCARAHEALNAVLEILNEPCPDTIYVVGKTVRILEAIRKLRPAHPGHSETNL